MLSHIYLHNFAIIETLDIELKSGLTALTGETGAGKSILIDAIGLVLGDRADSGVVRHGASRAEITLSVDLDDSPDAQQWLVAHELVDRDESQCILRRIITANGKSRAWINGTPCNLGMLRQLGEQLVDIHGQHEHQSLMKKEMQRRLLDDFAANHTLVKQVAAAYQHWNDIQTKIDLLTNQHQEYQAKRDLLRFQTQELDDLQLTEHEITQLDEEHVKLSSIGSLLETSLQSIDQLYDAEQNSIYSALSEILGNLESNADTDSNLRIPLEMLQNAQIQIQEAVDFLRRYHESLELDPERLNWVNERLSILHELARKHQTTPDQLYPKWQSLLNELESLEGDEYDLEALRSQLQEVAANYQELALKLSHKRQKSAQKLASGVSQAMQELGMEGGKFHIQFETSKNFTAQGIDQIEFQVSANPGQPLKSLIKVASGGELSRISLAIQMIAAQQVSLPALIFDEVDSGIGGGIAEVVGQQLRKLGDNRQVLCVTHLPQVASQAHNHYQVTKLKEHDATQTGMQILNDEQRIQELARMMGGIEITDSTLNLAKEMLAR